MSTTTTTTTTTAAEEGDSTMLHRIPKLTDLSPLDIGKYVKLHGWVYSTRTQGAGTLCFVDLGDGTTVAPVRCLAQAKSSEEEAQDNVYAYKDKSTASLLTNANDDEAHYNRLSFEELTSSSQYLSIGCSVMGLGYVANPPEGTSQLLEVKLLELFVVGGVADASKYPIQKSILKKPSALRPHYHARFRAPLMQQLLQIRSQALFAVHEFFHDENVPLLDPNILTANDCEGAGEVFKISPQQLFTKLPEVEAAPGKKKTKKKNKNNNKGGEGQAGAEAPPKVVEEEEAPLKVEEAAAAAAAEEATPSPSEDIVGLTVSSQLPLEAIAMGTGSVYTCQKSFRAEKSDTNKHLAEFLHVEYEQYFLTLPELMDQAERFVKHVMTKVLDRCDKQYEFMNQTHSSPTEFHNHNEYLKSLLDKPFVRITHKEAIEVLQTDVKAKVQHLNAQGKMVRLKFSELPKQGQDLGAEHEKYLVQKFGTFTFVTHWPSAIKSFYMKQVGDGTCESFDLLAPLVGELFGGSMREWRYEALEKMMKSKNMDMAPLQWYVDLRKDGTAPHGGWGMGFDRLVMFLTNTASVRDVVPYPVYYGHCPY